MRGLLLVALLAFAASAPGLAGGWLHATVGPDGAVRFAAEPPAADDFFPCTGFAPLAADCATGQHMTPFAMTLGWPACDNAPFPNTWSNCFLGDMLDVLTYQEPEQRQLVFKCTAFYLGVAGKMYDYACFIVGPWLFDVPFEHTCSMRAYGSTFAGPAPVAAYPREGAPGAVGSWYCNVATFAGWS